MSVLGHPLAVDLSQANERLLYYAAKNVVRTFRRTPLGRLMPRVLVRQRGDVFLDIGANLGVYSLIANELGARSLLFEPEPAHLDFLERNARAFGDVFGCALSDQAGTAEFHIANDHSLGASSLVGKATDDLYGATVSVPVRTLDEVASSIALDPAQVKLIKVDVEGNEARTVAGMVGFLASGAAPAVWCEVRGPASSRGGNSYREVTDLLGGVGYTAYHARHDRLVPFDPTAQRLRQVFDLLFVRPGSPLS